MGKVAVVVSVVALGAAGWAGWSLEETRKELVTLRGEVEVLAPPEARIAALEAGRTAPTPPPALPGAPPALGAEAPSLAPAPRGEPSVLAAKAAPPPAPRVEELEKRLAALEEKEKSAAGRFASVPGFARAIGGSAFYGSPDDAARDLDLDPAQRSDLDRIVADARRELDDLRKTPDEDGKSYEQLQKEMLEGTREGGMRIDLGKVLAWNGKTVPGRNETFGAADKRIRENARARLRETLRPEQQAKLDKAMIDPMLGRGGPGMVFSTINVEATPAPK